MGAFNCPTCIHKAVCKDELLNQPINKRCAHYIMEKKFTSTNMPRDEIRLIAESIVSCINGGQYDNAKVLAEAIIAELSPVG